MAGGPFATGKIGEGLDPRRWPAAVAGSGEQRRGEVGPWVGEMVGEVGDWFEETEERGLTRNDVSTVVAPYQRGLIDGGSVPWSARLTLHPENIVEPGRARGGEGEAGGGPERPTHSGVPSREEEGGRSGGGDRRLWLEHTLRKSAEWSERCAGPMRRSWRLKRERSRGVLSPMAGGIGGRYCAQTERAEVGSRASQGEIGLASTTAHGRQWIGTTSARGQRRAEHGVEHVGVGGRWRGGMAARGERCDEAMACAFKRWVRLAGGPSPRFDLIRFSKAPASKFTNMIFWMSKNGKTF
jgi:hypothetical protein